MESVGFIHGLRISVITILHLNFGENTYVGV
jgi:hypothetical protein